MSEPGQRGHNIAAASHGIADGCSLDAFLGGRLQIVQPHSGYRAGIDAVLLAAAAPVTTGRHERLLDAGSGVGVVGLCAMARCPEVAVTFIERDPLLAGLARENVERNGIGDAASVLARDLLAPGTTAALMAGGTGGFEHVLANPPYQIEGEGTASPHPIKAGANAMPAEALDGWLRFLAGVVVAGGTATLIHRADALGALLGALDGRFGAIRVLPVHPRGGEPANRVIVQGIKGSRAPLAIEPGLILHGDGQGFRPEIDRILREGAPLERLANRRRA